MQALAAVRDAGVPHGYIAAGAIRNTVWDVVLGRGTDERVSDVDVVYFDGVDEAREWEQVLAREAPGVGWEARAFESSKCDDEPLNGRNFARAVST
jgi:hypothetical protein